MQLYCRTIGTVLTVLAVHPDGDATPAEAYGEGVVVLPYAGPATVDDLLGRAAPAPDLLAYAKARRYQTETGGVTINGVPFATDDRSKLLLTGARSAAQADATFKTPWVAADGSTHQLAAADVIAVSNAVLAHVNACFTAFATLAAGLAATPPTVTTMAQVDAAFAGVTWSAPPSA